MKLARLVYVPRTRKRAGSNADRSTVLAQPSSTNSAIASPVAGAFRMPQTLCPVATNAPARPGTLPMAGGRDHKPVGRHHVAAVLAWRGFTHARELIPRPTWRTDGLPADPERPSSFAARAR